MGATTVGRSLKTARAVLHVLKEMESSRSGLTIEQVTEITGKSKATATYLLNSLVVEGFARRGEDKRYRSVDPDAETNGMAGPLRSVTAALLASTGQELYRHSGERAYIGRRDGESVAVHDTWGRQGQPLVPGLDAAVGGAAHALAIGKALFAHLGCAHLDEYVSIQGLTRFTPATITDRSALAEDLAATTERGVAVSVEEFAVGFVGLAAPVIGPSNNFVGVVGISLTRHKFDTNGDSLIAIVRHVAKQTGTRFANTVGALDANSTESERCRISSADDPTGPRLPETHNTGDEDVREKW